jgi:hypothetical protein
MYANNKFYNPLLLHELTRALEASKTAQSVNDLTELINNKSIINNELKNLKARISNTLRFLLKNKAVTREVKKTDKGAEFFYKLNSNNNDDNTGSKSDKFR